MQEPWATFFLIALIGTSAWGCLNGAILFWYLRHKRKKDIIIEGIHEANIAMTLNAACWLLLIAVSLVWPSRSDSTAPIAAQVSSAVAFMGASAGISFALHRFRLILYGPVFKTAE